MYTLSYIRPIVTTPTAITLHQTLVGAQKIEADSTDIEGGVTLSMLNDITSNLTGGCGTSLDGDDSLTDVKLEAGRGGEDDDDDDDELEEGYGPRDDVEVTTATDVRRLLTNPMVNMMTEAALLQGTFDSKPLGG